jgi:hypothetical protein
MIALQLIAGFAGLNITRTVIVSLTVADFGPGPVIEFANSLSPWTAILDDANSVFQNIALLTAIDFTCAPTASLAVACFVTVTSADSAWSD